MLHGAMTTLRVGPSARNGQRIGVFALLVEGDPIPKGSTRAFIPKGWKRPVITTASKNTTVWEKLVRDAAQKNSPKCFDGPMLVVLDFALRRPKRLKNMTEPCIKRPDLDKLVRCILDALTGVVWIDDSQVDHLIATKRYANVGEAAHVSITATHHAYPNP
jgi:crossover junction endodeoxyribonuclease RusA